MQLWLIQAIYDVAISEQQASAILPCAIESRVQLLSYVAIMSTFFQQMRKFVLFANNQRPIVHQELIAAIANITHAQYCRTHHHVHNASV